MQKHGSGWNSRRLNTYYTYDAILDRPFSPITNPMPSPYSSHLSKAAAGPGMLSSPFVSLVVQTLLIQPWYGGPLGDIPGFLGDIAVLWLPIYRHHRF